MTSNTKKRPGKQSAATAAETRETLLVAATEVFSRQGYDATSLRLIAAEAQLAHGSLRHHFGSKQDIWKACADRVLQHYQRELLPILQSAASSETPVLSFRKVVTGFIRVSHANPVFARLLMQEATHANERSAYVNHHFLGLHGVIEVLFNRARLEHSRLAGFSNDSFFLNLLSLTFFPLILPQVSATLLASTAESDSQEQHEQRILALLFGD